MHVQLYSSLSKSGYNWKWSWYCCWFGSRGSNLDLTSAFLLKIRNHEQLFCWFYKLKLLNFGENVQKTYESRARPFWDLKGPRASILGWISRVLLWIFTALATWNWTSYNFLTMTAISLRSLLLRILFRGRRPSSGPSGRVPKVLRTFGSGYKWPSAIYILQSKWSEGPFATPQYGPKDHIATKSI